MTALKGVFAASLTRLAADGAPDIAASARHNRWLLDTGCDGLAVLGTNGEANSFSLDERLRLLDGLAEAGLPFARLMPGTGCSAISDTVALTRRAVQLGAAGVLALPPFYYKKVSDDGLFAAYAETIERVGDGRLRVYLYHFPQMSAVPLSHELIERLIVRYPTTVVGIKDSSGDLANMTAMVARFPGFAVFAGADDLLLPVLRAGGAGCITGCANILAPVLQKIYRLWRGPEVEAVHALACAVRTVCSTRQLTSSLKAILARHSGEAEWNRLRPPLLPLADAETDALVADLAATGYRLPVVP